jgi:AcrR family transcriptional regulator
MYVRKATQAQATRELLKQTARTLFAERGFDAVSAEELVAKAGVTRGALYHHYDGKEGLFAAVVEAVMKDLHQALASAASGASDPLQALESGIRTFFGMVTEPGMQRILLIDGPSVLGWRAWREMDARYGLGLLKQAIGAATVGGMLRPQDPDVLAHLLLGAMTEAAMLIASSPEPSATRKTAEAAIAAMISGWAVES